MDRMKVTLFNPIHSYTVKIIYLNVRILINVALAIT